MKKLNDSQLRKISKNLDFYFNNANESDFKYGMNWYEDANKVCIILALQYNTTPFIVAGVISALSPRNKWEQNLKDAETVLNAVVNGISPEDVKVCTFHTNKFKAFAIAKGDVVITDKSLKTFNFVNNIANLDTTAVTVDIWHLRACFNEMFSIESAQIGRIAYEQIKSLTLKKASKLGLKGYQYQAIIWASVKNN